MKVFISIDMEGVAGITHWDQVDPRHPSYERARRLMVGELNAALRAAFDAGAECAVINDAHDEMRNLPPEDIWSPPDGRCRVRLITGSLKELSMMEGIQEGGHDCAIFLGYHGMAGGRGLLAHTYSTGVHSVRLNGHMVGEVTINAALAGAHRVPVILVAGEAAAVEEAGRHLGSIAAVVTKSARSRFSAATLLPDDCREVIYRAVRDAVAKVKERIDAERGSEARPDVPMEEWDGPRAYSGDCSSCGVNVPEGGEERPLPPGCWLPPKPYLIEVNFMNAGMADAASLLPGANRRGTVTVTYQSDDFVTCFKAFRCMLQLAEGIS